MTTAMLFEVVAVPTRAKGEIVLGTYATASEAVAGARFFQKSWPEDSFKLEIREAAE